MSNLESVQAKISETEEKIKRIETLPALYANLAELRKQQTIRAVAPAQPGNDFVNRALGT